MSAASFLTRWSLRKQASRAPATPAAEPPVPAEAEGAGPLAADVGDTVAGADETVDGTPASEASAACPEARSDLPDLADLDAGSDYRGFLDRQVPRAVRVAALRKAWASDPVIAGYRPLADYDWDFNAPGYAALRPTDDPGKFITALFRHLQPKPDETTVTAAEEPAGSAADAATAPSEPAASQPDPDTADATPPPAADLDAASDASIRTPFSGEDLGRIRGPFPGEDPGPIAMESSTTRDRSRHGSRLEAGKG